MQLDHNVFFKLHDSSPAKVQALVDACKKYLCNHPGVVSFGVGTLNTGLRRPVNDLQYDVSLHVTFDCLASHDAYQVAPDHLKFIEEQKANWAQVRVFDSDLR